jgi:3-hydroxyisobutyrate dehydrogenase-like beta-hydroxyacid dehydrogenase
MDTQFSPQSAKVGIIHPGQMGGTIARGLHGSGNIPYWASEGRSEVTAARAEEFHMIDLGTVEELFKQCDVVFCIVNGGSLMNYAEMAVELKYSGIYVDANGLWGEESEQELADILTRGGIQYVEAGLYGWPHPGREGHTDEHTMYLSGDRAKDVGSLFTCGYWDIMYTEEKDDITAKKFKRLRNDRERAENIALGRDV